MNWADYMRGYDDGVYQGRVGRGSGNIFVSLLQLLFAIILMALVTCYKIVKFFLTLLALPFQKFR